MAITFPAAPTNGQVYTDTTSGQSWTFDGVKWKGASSTAYWKRTGTAVEPYTAGDTIQGQLVPTNGALGSRNVIINGDLRINQRNVTIAAAAVGAYGPDRWKKVDAGSMTQVVEDLNFVPGAKYTLSWKGGTPQVLTAPGSGHWTLPNIPITATEVQLELGEVATPYEHCPPQLTMIRCRRYFVGLPAGYQVPIFWNTTMAFYRFSEIAMRTNPTVSNASQAVTSAVYNLGTGTSIKTPNTLVMSASVNADGSFLQFPWTANLEGLTGTVDIPAAIGISAEL